MLENTEINNTQLRLQEVNKALDDGMFVLARSILDKMPACDVAFLLESSPPANRKVLWNLTDHDQHGEILEELNEDAKDGIINLMGTDNLVAATEGMETDGLSLCITWYSR